jgi:Ca2+-binding EF-hand superfamily protein
VFDTPEERNHTGASNSASGIQGSARVPNAINRDRQPSNAATQSFVAVDRNGDGTLDRNEARNVRGLDFERVDTNQNGRIEPREYEADAAARDR